MYCKHCGKQIDNDSKFCLFCGGSIETTSPSIQNTPSTETIKTYALPAKKEIAVGIIMSAILCFVSAIVFFYFGVLQTGLISGLLGLWTITVSFVYIAIGIAILLTRKWAYDWGLGSAIINILFLKYSYSQNDSNLFLFLILVQIAIAILLYINREYFKNKANIHTTVAIEQEQIEQINDLAKLYSLITTKKKKLFGNNTTEILTLMVQF